MENDSLTAACLARTGISLLVFVWTGTPWFRLGCCDFPLWYFGGSSSISVSSSDSSSELNGGVLENEYTSFQDKIIIHRRGSTLSKQFPYVYWAIYVERYKKLLKYASVVLLLLGYEVFHHHLGNGCGGLRLGRGFVPLCRLGSLGLFDGRARHHLGGSGGKTAGSRSDLYNCTDING